MFSRPLQGHACSLSSSRSTAFPFRRHGPCTLLGRLFLRKARAAGHELLCKQSNAEGALVDWLQEHRDAAFVLINAASLTHTSLALRDALAFVDVPFVEIHISNVYKREPFRHRSFLSDLAVGMIVGLGALGYDLALQYALHHIRQNSGGG